MQRSLKEKIAATNETIMTTAAFSPTDSSTTKNSPQANFSIKMRHKLPTPAAVLR